jgi:hypothetical protein
MNKEKLRSFFTNKKFIIGLWLVMSVVTGLKCYLTHNPSENKLTYNNYNIFAGVYHHTLEQKPLYPEYPEEYFDSNYYGPFFTVIIAPFAIMPDWLGIVLWNLANTLLLAFALFKLPIKESHQVAIAWITAHELLTAQLALQFNVGIVGLILLSFIYNEKKQHFYNSSAIVIGLLVKLYGIIGLTFFLFNKEKLKFIAIFLLVLILGLILPLLITTDEFLIQSYKDWFNSLVYKSSFNESVSDMANISVMGFMNKCFGIYIHVLEAVAFGASVLLFILIYKKNSFENLKFRLYILCYLLLCLVLFNTNVESPTYIIAFIGVGIWFTETEKNKWTIFLLIFALLLTSFSPSDLFPKFVRETYVKPYALKVVPCIFIWLDLTYRLIFEKFNDSLISIKSSDGKQ